MFDSVWKVDVLLSGMKSSALFCPNHVIVYFRCDMRLIHRCVFREFITCSTSDGEIYSVYHIALYAHLLVTCPSLELSLTSISLVLGFRG